MFCWIIVFFSAFSIILCLSNKSLSPFPPHVKVPLLDGRVVGGQAANIEQFPYQLSLLYRDQHICGASLIHSKWAVTASHCVHNFNHNELAIRAGSSIRNYGGQVVKVKKATMHPYYNPNTIDFDVAVLELASPVTIPSARTVILPSTGTSLPEGTTATVSGWGYLHESGPAPSQLQVLRIPIIPHEVCARIYGASTLTQRMFCAGYIWGAQQDSCYGDSGGPLVVNGVLYGVVSWGYGCAKSGYPGVYANVPVLSNFIKGIAKF